MAGLGARETVVKRAHLARIGKYFDKFPPARDVIVHYSGGEFSSIGVQLAFQQIVEVVFSNRFLSVPANDASFSFQQVHGLGELVVFQKPFEGVRGLSWLHCHKVARGQHVPPVPTTDPL